MLQWIFPEPVHRTQATGAWLRVLVEAYAAAGVVDGPTSFRLWWQP